MTGNMDNSVSVLRGNGDGTFGTPTVLNGGTGALQVQIGDLNGDGSDDFVTADVFSNTVSIFTGRGDGTFNDRQSIAVGTQPSSVPLADVNEDGDLDIVVSNLIGPEIRVLLNDGNAGFSLGTVFSTPAGAQSVLTHDFNLDGHVDLAVTQNTINRVDVHLGDGAGSFGAAISHAVGARPIFSALADFDKDGFADLAVPNYDDNTVSLLRGRGDGQFDTGVTLATGARPYAVTVADLNGDGFEDFTVANMLSDMVNVFLGNGQADFQQAFTQQTDVSVGKSSRNVAIGDWDGNGTPDLAVSGEATANLAVFLNLTNVNNAPVVVSPLGDVTVDEDAPDSMIDLFATFADAEDADADLTYTIESNTAPALFTATTIDGAAGTLTLDYAPEASGTADITVRATDTGGMFVEDTFTVTLNSISRWEFNEGTGVTAYDSAGSDDGTLVNGPTWQTIGMIDGALSFDGVDDYVEVPDSPSLDMMTAITMEAWVQFDSVDDRYDTILAKVNASDPLDGSAYYLRRTRIDATSDSWMGRITSVIRTTDGRSQAKSPDVAIAGQWYHVVSTYDGTALKLYVNGTLEATTAATGEILQSDDPLWLGRNGHPTYPQPLMGTLDDAAIYSRALSAAEIQTRFDAGWNDAPVVSAPIASLSVDENAPDTVIDLFAAFEDAQDVDADLTYTIESNTNPGLFAATNIDPVAGTLTLNYAASTPGAAKITVRATDTRDRFVEDSFVINVLGTISHWEFNDGTGTAANDSSGSNDGILNGGPSWTTGMIDGALDFDGVDDYISVPDSPSLDMMTAITMEAWVQFDSVDDRYDTILAKVNASDPLDGSAYYLRRTRIDATADSWMGRITSVIRTTDGRSQAQSPDIAIAGQWYQVVSTYDGTALKLYVNGTLKATTAATGEILQSDDPLWFGRNGHPTYPQPLMGTLDDAAIYSRALTAAEIEARYLALKNEAPTIVAPISDVTVEEDAADTVIDLFAAFDDAKDADADLTYTIESNTAPALFAATTIDGTAGTLTLDYAPETSGTADITVRATDTGGLFVEDTFTVTLNSISRWEFNEGTGVTAYDSAGSDDGTLVNGPTWQTIGMIDGALSFDGVDDYVEVPDSPSLDMMTAITMEAWVQLDSIDNTYDTIVWKPDDTTTNNRDYALIRNRTGDFSAAWMGKFGTSIQTTAGYSEVFGTTIPTAGGWYHVVSTYDGESLKLYVNGQLESSQSHSGTLVTSDAPLLFGKSGNPTDPLWLNGTLDEVSLYSRAMIATEIEARYLALKNEAPIVDVPIADVSVPENSNTTVIDLFAAFEDTESADAELAFTIESNTNPALFNAATIDSSAGTLTLSYAANTPGATEITVRATDTGGRFVEDAFVVNVEGVISRWEFLEVAGTTAADSAGSNDGTLINGPAWQPIGMIDGALSFDGVDDYVEIPDSPSLDLATAITMEAWVQIDSIDNTYDTILWKHDDAAPNDRDYALLRNRTGDFSQSWMGKFGSGVETTAGLSEVYSTFVPTAGEWYYVVGTYDGSTHKLYVNGQFESSASHPGTIRTSDDPLFIGRSGRPTDSLPLNGTIDDVSLHNRALSAAEIQARYLALKNEVPEITISFDATTLDEGATLVGNGSFIDADADDTWTGTIDYGDGTGVQPLVLNADKTFQLSQLYPDDGEYTVSVEVTDSKGKTGSAQQLVTVNNVAPTISVTGPESVDEGSVYTLTLGDVTDPGDDTVSEYTVHWGDGLSDTYTESGEVTHTYADGLLNADTGQEISVLTQTTSDTFITDYQAYGGPNSTHADSATLVAINSFAYNPSQGTLASRPMFKFDLDQHAGQTALGDALFRACVSGGHHQLTARTVNLYRVTSAWDDDTVTWNTRPGTAYIATQSVRYVGDNRYIEWTVPQAVVQGWLDDPSTNYGVMLVNVAPDATSYDLGFASLEHSANAPAQLEFAVTGPTTITVDLTDEDGTHVGAGSKTIDVNNVAPSFEIGADVTLSPDDAGILSRLAVPFTDPGADTWTGTVDYGDGSGPQELTIDSVAKTFDLAHTYSSDGNYTVSVTIQDDDGGTFTDSFNAAVEINSAPAVISPIADIEETEDAADTVISLVGVFEDVDGDVLTLSAESSNETLVTATVIGTDLTLHYLGDQHGSATITVSASDGTESVSDPFTVTVSPVNDAPTVVSPLGDVAVDEDAADTVISLLGVFGDVDEDALTLSAASSDESLVTATVIGTDLTLHYLGDQHGSATITVSASDGTESVSNPFAVTVSPVNDAPTFTKGADQTVLEDAGAQTVAAWTTNISAGPADEAGQTLAFNVSTSNDGLFAALPAIDPFTGDLTYTPADDANGTSTVTVSLSDNGGGSDTSANQTFVIDVTAVNDAPTFTKGADSTVLEDAGAQTVAAWATNISTGPADEAGQTFSFNVSTNNDGLFAALPVIDPLTGDLTYTPADDANGTATVTVNLSDDGGGADTSASQTFVIDVTAVNDAPSVGPHTFAVDENSSSGTSVGIVAASDPDADDTIGFAIVGGTGSTAFTVNTTTGEITVADSTQLDFEITPTFTLDVEVTDNGGLSDTAIITINLNDLPEGGPVVTSTDRSAWQEYDGTGTSGLVHVTVTLDEAINSAVEAAFDAYRQHLIDGNANQVFELADLKVRLVNSSPISIVCSSLGPSQERMITPLPEATIPRR